MFKKTVIGMVLLLSLFFFSSNTAWAESAITDEFADAKNLISQKIACGQLSQDQLEKIGDYYMEQMAPGAAHTQMERIMGGEGSASLLQAHIFMARRWYCGDATGFTMMGMMGGGYPYISSQIGLNRGFFGRGMMGLFGNNGWGMMSGWGNGLGYYGGFTFMNVLGVLFFVTGIAVFVKYLLKK